MDASVGVGGERRSGGLTGVRVMLVHTDPGRCHALGEAMRRRGLDVVVATSAEGAMAALQAAPVGALVGELEACTAGASGLTQWLETHLPTLPVIYGLRERRVEDVVRAIQAGCADVVVLSDDVERTAEDLVAALTTHSRSIRQHWLLENILATASVLSDADMPESEPATGRRIVVGHVQLNLDDLVAIVAEAGAPLRKVRLTPTECQLLATLMSQAGHVLSVADLGRDALGYHSKGRDLANAVRHQVARLREKIETDPARPTLVHTVRGRGYVFDPHWLA